MKTKNEKNYREKKENMEKEQVKQAKKFMFTTMMNNGLKYGNVHSGDNFLDYTPRCFHKHFDMILECYNNRERFVVYKWEINQLTLYIMGRSGVLLNETNLSKNILEIIKSLVFSESLKSIYDHLEILTGIKFQKNEDSYASILSRKDELSRPGSPV